MKPTGMSVARATAIAVTNAAIKHLKLGLFMSELNAVDEHDLRFSKFVGNARFALSGRTTSGTSVLVHATIIFKQARDASFPIEKAYVAVTDVPSRSRKCFQCDFSGDDIVVVEIDASRLRESGERPNWQTDDSPEAWSDHYRS